MLPSDSPSIIGHIVTRFTFTFTIDKADSPMPATILEKLATIAAARDVRISAQKAEEVAQRAEDAAISTLFLTAENGEEFIDISECVVDHEASVVHANASGIPTTFKLLN